LQNRISLASLNQIFAKSAFPPHEIKEIRFLGKIGFPAAMIKEIRFLGKIELGAVEQK
jgi:hypothetical protein